MAEPYSPLRYPGGKAKLTALLVRVMEHNGIRNAEYVEPFAGGAGAALRLLCEEYVDSIIINDADVRIWAFWEAITRHNEQFLDLLRDVSVSVDEWLTQREIYERRDLRSVLRLGFATFYLNRTARSGIVHNGGPIGGYDQQGKYKIGVRFNRQQLARRIERIGAYSDRIEVSRHDGLALLRYLARRRHRQGTFVYLDPPYYSKGRELYMNMMTHGEHAALARFLGRPRKLPWIMTYDNVREVRQLYSTFPHIAFNLTYSAYERREGQELLIHPTHLELPTEVLRALPRLSA